MPLPLIGIALAQAARVAGRAIDRNAQQHAANREREREATDPEYKAKREAERNAARVAALEYERREKRRQVIYNTIDALIAIAGTVYLWLHIHDESLWHSSSPLTIGLLVVGGLKWLKSTLRILFGVFPLLGCSGLIAAVVIAKAVGLI